MSRAISSSTPPASTATPAASSRRRFSATTGDQSAVFHQPETDDELLAAQKALISCPTASIGSVAKHDMRRGAGGAAGARRRRRLPLRLHLRVVVRRDQLPDSRPQGNILIDSPRFSGPLVKNIAAMGGASRMLLTHQDDVADHAEVSRRASAASASCIATTSARAPRRSSCSRPASIRSSSATTC